MKKAGEIAFLKAVELGSIRAAARALNQDPSGVSRRITQLEQRLGTKLVDRAGNATIPTEQGQIYYEGLSKIVDQLEALDQQVSGEHLTPRGLLRVTSAIDFGQEFLTDWLFAFRERYPEVEYDLVLASGFIDMVQENVDVAIRVGSLPDSALIAKKLADAPRVLVAAPSYLERRGTPTKPADLETHDFVFFLARNRTQPLELIDKKGGRHQVMRSKGVAINAIRSAVKTVTAGAGIHNGPLWAFAGALKRGDVTLVLPDYHQSAFPLYAVRKPSVVVPARISHFIDHVAECVKSVDGLEPV
ncbi:MAG: LysR family transcriptional regulator [Pseudomonadota bacterium]